jgi:glycosyltransferase involved in cell wall biosynthesis
MKKILFVANMPSFIVPIVEYFNKKDDWTATLFVDGTEEELQAHIDSAHVIWIEWCNEVAIAMTNLIKDKKAKVICRLHSYEAFTTMPAQVDWTKIDHLIFVNPSVMEIMKMSGLYQVVPSSVTVSIIPNTIEDNKWVLTDITEKKSKIAYVGHINYKKDSSLIFPIAEALPEPYSIYSAGLFQDLRYKLMFDQYMGSVKNPKVHFTGKQDNMSRWMVDKRFTLNTSLFESFNYGIAEGMLSGAIPLVRNWLGADNVYPNIPKWNTMGELLTIITYFDNLPLEDQRKMQKDNRDFIIDNYGVNSVMPHIEELIV